jgi:pyruvate kinase
LGVQLGLVELARQVARLDPHALEVPVLMAGQVLEHLTQHEQPTRSEICHLIDLVARGYAGIVLSDETAIGVGPANAVRWAARLMREH